MSKLWQSLKNNWGLKLAALFFAVLLWSFSVSQADPDRTKVFSDMPIEVIGLDALYSNGLDIKGDTYAVFDVADVSITLKYSEMSRLNSNAVGIIANVSDIKSPGTYEIALSARTPLGSIAKLSPSTITIEVEERTTAAIPITVQKTGTAPSGMYIGDASLSMTEIEISGAKTDVESVKSAYVALDQSRIKDYYTGTLEIVLLDDAGQPLSYKRFTQTQPTVDVTVQPYPTKQVAVDISDILHGSPAAHYKVVGVTADPYTITIAGTAETLAGISGVKVTPVDIAGESETVEIKAAVILPPNTMTTGVKEVVITVTITHD